MGWKRMPGHESVGPYYLDEDRDCAMVSVADWRPDINDAQCSDLIETFVQKTGYYFRLETDYASNYDGHGWWCQINESYDAIYVFDKIPNSRRLAVCIAIATAQKMEKALKAKEAK